MYSYYCYWITFGINLKAIGFWVNGIDWLKLGILNLLKRVLFKPIGSKEPSRLLVVRKGTIGDHVVCQPIYLAILDRYANTRIDLLTSNGGLDYAHISKLPEHVLFNETINFDDYAKGELMRKIRSNQYDMVIELPQDLDTIYTQSRNMFFYRFCGIKQGIGWSPGISRDFRSHRFYHHRLKREWQKHAYNLTGLGIDINERYLPTESVELPPGYGKMDFSQMVAVAPGAKLLCKQWPHFNELVNRLVKSNYIVLLVGGKQDHQLIDNPKVTNLCGKLNIHQSKYVLSKVKLLVCNDSGPMHLAYSAQTPLIACFGGRSYPKAWWPPEAGKNEVLFSPAKYPVGYFGQHKIEGKVDHHLRSITTDEVMEKVIAMLRNDNEQVNG